MQPRLQLMRGNPWNSCRLAPDQLPSLPKSPPPSGLDGPLLVPLQGKPFDEGRPFIVQPRLCPFQVHFKRSLCSVCAQLIG